MQRAALHSKVQTILSRLAMRILVIGGTGFIGRQVVTRLVEDGHFVHVPTRSYKRGRDLLLLPTVTLFESDVHDDAVLEPLIDECDAVINLVGILHSSPGQPYGPEFARAHVELPARVARICRARGVRRLMHISALGADSAGPSAYLRSKAAGEAAIIDAFAGYEEGACTIFRPSIVFGPEDHFTNLFAKLARWLPILAVPGAQARMQPIYVGDVAAAMAGALTNSQTWGQI
jgi:NADH dehydrogenase